MPFFSIFYALFFSKAYATTGQLCSRVMLFFRNMPLRMLRFGGGNMLQKPFYATAVVLSCYNRVPEAQQWFVLSFCFTFT